MKLNIQMFGGRGASSSNNGSISSSYKVQETENGYKGKGSELLKFIRAEEKDSGVSVSASVKKTLKDNPNTTYTFDGEKLVGKASSSSTGSNFNNITSRVIRMYNKNQSMGKVGDKLKITVWRNRKETAIDKNTTRQDNTNTATIYSYANAKNKNDYANMKVVGIIEEKGGKWRRVKNATSRIKTSGRETYSVIER